MNRIGTTYLLGKEDREPSHNIHICSHYDQKWKIFSEFHPDYQEKVQNLVDWKRIFKKLYIWPNWLVPDVTSQDELRR